MLVLIDGNAVGNACHRTAKLTVGELEVQAIYGFLRTLRATLEKHPNDEFLVLWDGRAEHRFEMHPGYKEERRKRREADPAEMLIHQSYEKQARIIRLALRRLGVHQLSHPSWEADDLAGHLVRNTSRDVLLVTGDEDWLQLVSERVSWYDPRNGGKRVTHETFLDSTGYHTPREFLQGKALQGDRTDSIPGVGGVGEKRAMELIAEFRSVEAFWAKVDGGWTPKQKWQRDLATPEARQRFAQNMALMNLIDPERTVDPKTLTLDPGQFSEGKFRLLCDELAFMSITGIWDSWIAPFRNRRSLKQAA